MSVESIAIALHHSRATGSAKLILVGIANHDGDGGAWPSIATLARYAGVTARNAQKAIDRLVELGEVLVHVQQGGTARTPDHAKPNLYQIVLTCPPDCDRTKNHQSKYKLPDPLSLATPPVASDTPPPVASDTRPLSLATPEPSFNHPRKEITSKGDQQRMPKVQPAPYVPRYVPEPQKPKPAPRTTTEAEAVSDIESLACPAAPGFHHWLPLGSDECVRGCGTTIHSHIEVTGTDHERFTA